MEKRKPIIIPTARDELRTDAISCFGAKAVQIEQ